MVRVGIHNIVLSRTADQGLMQTRHISTYAHYTLGIVSDVQIQMLYIKTVYLLMVVHKKASKWDSGHGTWPEYALASRRTVCSS